MQKFFGYIRVSTVKQGEKGVSLQEQRGAIESYARRFNLDISRWFEERETAAKSGRPVFSEMLKLLRQGKSQGVIIHKIDRSARNLKDWANLGEMIDAGIQVHFVNESLDLHSRGGRLSADIQAVVASDYIRNLREETRKGFYGRLKQGFYPLPAPIGYLDQGKANPKVFDPERAQLVAEAFRLYATGEYSLPSLLQELDRRGLRNRRAGKVSLNGLSRILNNPFYVGLIRIAKTGELFPGSHKPLVSKALFDRVQHILQGKTANRLVQHEFIFRRMVRCGDCGYSLIGELQKGHVYYRCHNSVCSTKTIREDRLDDTLNGTFTGLLLDQEEIDHAREWIKDAHVQEDAFRIQEIENLKFRLNQIRPHLERLTDAFLDGTIERDLFERRKNTLLMEEAGLKQRVAVQESGTGNALRRLEKFLELVNTASFLYKQGIPEEKRDLVKEITSNLQAIEKNVVVELKKPARLIFERAKLSYGSPYKGVPRTWDKILAQLLKHFTDETAPAN
ncbi:MAG: recombinase family protein [Terriglobia bacterium]|jgi:DNA invertase Pin-like site-specific DNA recombinase